MVDSALTTDLLNKIPPYAILSHTWGADDEEVTFDDLENGRGKSKAGYAKIQFCGEQPKKDKDRLLLGGHVLYQQSPTMLNSLKPSPPCFVGIPR